MEHSKEKEQNFFTDIGQMIHYFEDKETINKEFLLAGLKYLLKNDFNLVKKFTVNSDQKFSTQFINDQIKNNNVDTNLISDGYHTFSDLYEHRNTLFIALCRNIHTYNLDKVTDDDNDGIWKTRFDFENKYCGDGWFIMGIGTRKGQQVTYHLPFKFWKACDFAKNVEKVPAFDGHNSKDVINRLLKHFIEL